ncbi:serine/threonine protein kinase [Aestuariivirga litoralis]|uniref:Serine/threonine protein kinase n=1 Tax=Aestuariivirga litoralis TaxID=2650924 RepID=A0A2W2BAQ8_9HYPH|nr:bifunctional serine/threonine-protein kinase/universal stress protein [Aestuariivirga litoralis]PZF77188.1 serine/threonine protein kinase [Aestuariivirga litoralis]
MAKSKLETGSILDGFTIGELIHRGGMASLWEVKREGDPTHYLMKIPVLNEGEDPAAIVSFEMEQMIMPRLKGAHVPRHVANGDFAVQPFIVMERLAGETLLPQLKHLPLPVDKVAEMGAAIADALESLHRQGVIHLDLKPSNIMFRPSGEAVLIDYGLAHHRDLPDLLQEEFRLPYGTAPYMAPEQVMGIRTDPRSDIFALGCLMYFFATGVRPFGDPQKLKGLKQRLWRDPVPPRKLKPDIPPWFQEIVLRCLEVKAGRRYPTPAQLAHDLRNPTQVQLSARAEKLQKDGFFAVLKRKGEPPRSLIDKPPEREAEASDAPIVAAAINLDDMTPELADKLRRTLLRILERSPEARLAVLNVLKLNRIAMDQTLDEEGNNKHVARLVGLKDWARPMKIAQGRVTYHVLEAIDPADTLLDYARVNNVDHIVMGARANSTMRKILGSVSGKVAMEAPCTVTVVRVRGAEE